MRLPPARSIGLPAWLEPASAEAGVRPLSAQQWIGVAARQANQICLEIWCGAFVI
jgi:hypothetical protein